MDPQSPAPEFSIEVDLDALPRGGETFHLLADADERAAIAKRLGALAVDRLEGDVRVVATPAAIVVEGRIDATLRRECIASLEAFEETVDEPFEIEFVRTAPSQESDDAWNAPEVHEGRFFDVGELIVQQLSLAMNPFPRKPDAPSLADEYGRAPESAPFSALAGKFKKSDENQ